jgi:hypothetical protein
MKIVIEFYRTRNADDAHAVIGRETKEAVNTDDAIEVARQLSQTLRHAAATGRYDNHRRERCDPLLRRHQR